MEKITLTGVISRAVRKFREDGGHIDIAILPNKVGLKSVWVMPCYVSVQADAEGNLFARWNDSVEPFDSFLNSYKYYNCVPELSKNRGVHYYLR